MPDSPTPPQEPVSLALAKQQLRVTSNDEDVLITGHISAARRHVERMSGLVLMRRQFTEDMRLGTPWLELVKAPVVSIDSATYIDGEGAEQEYLNPRLTTWHKPARLHPAIGAGWPQAESLRVTYTAGFAPGEADPDLINAILVLLVPFYERRSEGAEFEAARTLCDLARDII